MNEKLLGVGIYSVRETAALTGAETWQVRRWLKGYRYRRDNSVRDLPPLWKPTLPQLENKLVASFNDLLEVRFVRAFRAEGVSLQKIRRAVRELAELLDSDYPFSHQKVLTDGVDLFTELRDQDGSPLLYELSGRRNFAFRSVVYPGLTAGLVFDSGGRVTRWYPDKEAFNRVVVDPQVCFGHPVIEGTRIEPRVLARAHAAERSVDKVADWYEIDAALVQQAIDFQSRFAV